MMSSTPQDGGGKEEEEDDDEIDRYYRFFLEMTGGTGVALDDERLLGAPEYRKEWSDKFRQIVQHCLNSFQDPLLRICSWEELFRQRIIPPELSPTRTSETLQPPSSMSTLMRDEITPSISEWTDFDTSVVQAFHPFTPHSRAFPDKFLPSIFYNSISYMKHLQTKDMERIALMYCLRDALVETNLVSGGIALSGGRGMGRIDFGLYTKKIQWPVIVCKFVSSHNLQLPKTTTELVDQYHGAETTTKQLVGQLLNQMAANFCCYGALSSASRTYFVHIVLGRNSNRRVLVLQNVEISRAWFVGEANYIKAWAYHFDMGCKDNDRSMQKWILPGRKCEIPKEETTEEQQNMKSMPNKKQKCLGSDQDLSNSVLATMVPMVDYGDFKFLNFISEGRNGWTFRALWNGTEVAVKQYDCTISNRGFDAFLAETAAYAKLKDAWGELVPKPLFLSEWWSGGIYLLGMQLGRNAEGADASQRSHVLRTLKREHGIRHLDAEERNFLLIPSEDGCEKLVVIDLEECEYVPLKKKRK